MQSITFPCAVQASRDLTRQGPVPLGFGRSVLAGKQTK
jgi:hypothetical protein